MSDINLTQQEADRLIALEKVSVINEPYIYPAPGGRISVPLSSQDNREQFVLDIHRGYIRLNQVTYANRVRISIMLLRLDIDGPPHRNPDGQEIPCPHLHVYREGFSDKWAQPVPKEIPIIISDIQEPLNAFMKYCNICKTPVFERRLF